jgi:hypothetical protein
MDPYPNLLPFIGTQAVFAPSKYGKRDVLIVAQYEYKCLYTRKKDEATVWECCKCKVKAETRGGLISLIANHGHNPDANASSKRAVKALVKDAALTLGRGATRTVIAETLQVGQFTTILFLYFFI